VQKKGLVAMVCGTHLYFLLQRKFNRHNWLGVSTLTFVREEPDEVFGSTRSPGESVFSLLARMVYNFLSCFFKEKKYEVFA
jgi:hypothetical protein